MTGRAELDRGRGLRDKCKSLSKTTWNHHERRQNNSVENAFQRFALSFLSYEENMISDEEFLLLYDEYSSKNPEFEPLVSWRAQWLSCCKNTSGWRLWYEERLVLKFPIIKPPPTPPARCSKCVNDLFQFCAVAVHAIQDSFSCRSEQGF